MAASAAAAVGLNWSGNVDQVTDDGKQSKRFIDFCGNEYKTIIAAKWYYFIKYTGCRSMIFATVNPTNFAVGISQLVLGA